MMFPGTAEEADRSLPHQHQRSALHVLPGVGHAEFTDPGSAAWAVARVAILASIAESA